MKRIIALELALLLAVSAAVSCSEKQTSGGENTAAPSVSTTAAEADEESGTTYEAAVPDGTDYEGAEIRFYTYPDSTSGQYWVDVIPTRGRRDDKRRDLSAAAFIRRKS